MIGYMYYNSRVQRYILSTNNEQEKEIELRTGRMVEYFRFIDSELKSIANQEQILTFFNGTEVEKAKARKNLTDQFSELMTYTGLYDQIRVIDAYGDEQIRVNYEGRIPHAVSREDLQFKGTRDFFKETIKLRKNEIYLSQFDLNQENDFIQYPVKPVIRIATPIVDADNSRKGVLVFNLLGETFLHSLRDMGKKEGWQTYMLNDEGYYLMGPDPLKNWSSHLLEGSGFKFEDEFPRIDRLMRSTDKATVSTAKGIFSFCTISEYNFSKVNVDVTHISETWYIVSHLPQAQLRKGIAGLFDFKDILLLTFGLVFVASLSFLFTSMVIRRKLFEQRLIESSHDLKVANGMKDKFISILAHDLKNPLASVTGFVDILRDDFVNMSSESRHKIVTAMDNSTKMLIRLIDDVLIWARNQNDAAVQEPEIIFVNKIIDDAVRFSHMQASKKEIKLKINAQEEFFAMADPQMIETVLRNLISNAIKFSPRHGSVEVGVKQKDDTYVVVYVSDNGVGIKEKARKKLFSLEGFQTTPGTENEKGTGMGLIICKDFVERNNGTIWVESTENKGSTFKFTLLAYHE